MTAKSFDCFQVFQSVLRCCWRLEQGRAGSTPGGWCDCRRVGVTVGVRECDCSRVLTVRGVHLSAATAGICMQTMWQMRRALSSLCALCTPAGSGACQAAAAWCRRLLPFTALAVCFEKPDAVSSTSAPAPQDRADVQQQLQGAGALVAGGAHAPARRPLLQVGFWGFWGVLGSRV